MVMLGRKKRGGGFKTKKKNSNSTGKSSFVLEVPLRY